MNFFVPASLSGAMPVPATDEIHEVELCLRGDVPVPYQAATWLAHSRMPRRRILDADTDWASPIAIVSRLKMSVTWGAAE
jgi:hypothetical protein